MFDQLQNVRSVPHVHPLLLFSSRPSSLPWVPTSLTGTDTMTAEKFPPTRNQSDHRFLICSKMFQAFSTLRTLQVIRECKQTKIKQLSLSPPPPSPSLPPSLIPAHTHLPCIICKENVETADIRLQIISTTQEQGFASPRMHTVQFASSNFSHNNSTSSMLFNAALVNIAFRASTSLKRCCEKFLSVLVSLVAMLILKSMT
eukprot:764791-Hanusia_phi.AAC.1